MIRIIIAILLSFIGPGLGQFYNRDYKKGTLLLILSSALFLLPLIWLMLKVSPQLPNPKDQALSQEAIQNIVLQTVKGDMHTLNLISFAFLGIWAYAITQAYFKAKEINEKEKSNEDSESIDDDKF